MPDTDIHTDETHRLIASNKVEGTAVYNREGERLGSVHHFMVDKRSGQAEYAVLSFGGLFGLWVALTRPDLFNAYILTSPSIWWLERALLQTETDYAARHKDLKATIYLATGSLERPGPCPACKHDMVADQQELVRRLRSRKYPGLRIKAEVVEGTIHELTFPVGLAHALQWMFYDPETGRADLIQSALDQL